MGLVLQDLRNDLRNMTGTDVFDLPDVDADRFLNMSWWELQDKVKFREKESQAEISLVAGVQNYTLASYNTSIESISYVSIRAITETGYDPVLKREYENINDVLDTVVTNRGRPEWYARYGGDIYLCPIPDKAYILRLLFRKTLADLSVSGAPVPQVWHEFILLGGGYRVFRQIGEYKRSREIKAERDALSITTEDVPAKERVDYHQVGVRILKRRYP